jgi:hypothetical protein
MREERVSCKAIAKNGQPCKAAPMKSGFCHFHENPDRASQLGRLGGQNNRREKGSSAPAFPKMANCESALEILQGIFEASREGSLRPAVANVLIKVLNLQTEVLAKTRVEQQIAELQKQLTFLQSTINIQNFTNSVSRDEYDSEGESDLQAECDEDSLGQ